MSKILTIVVPMYNVQEYIIKTLDSLKKINTNDVEILLIDDASTDDTCFKVESYIENNRITNMQIKKLDRNYGSPMKARNLGIELTETKYVGFLDADDTINSDVLNKYLPELIEGKYDYFRFSVKVILENTLPLRYRAGKRTKTGKYNDVLLMNCPFLWNSIFKTDIIKENNLTIRDGISEDFNFNIHYSVYTKRVMYVDEDLVNYYKENSTMSKKNDYRNIKTLLENNLDSCKVIFSKELKFSKKVKIQFVKKNFLQFMIYNMDFKAILNAFNQNEQEVIIGLINEMNAIFFENNYVATKEINFDEIYTSYLDVMIYTNFDDKYIYNTIKLNNENLRDKYELNIYPPLEDISIGEDFAKLYVVSSEKMDFINKDRKYVILHWIKVQNKTYLVKINRNNEKIKISTYSEDFTNKKGKVFLIRLKNKIINKYYQIRY